MSSADDQPFLLGLTLLEAIIIDILKCYKFLSQSLYHPSMIPSHNTPQNCTQLSYNLHQNDGAIFLLRVPKQKITHTCVVISKASGFRHVPWMQPENAATFYKLVDNDRHYSIQFHPHLDEWTQWLVHASGVA